MRRPCLLESLSEKAELREVPGPLSFGSLPRGQRAARDVTATRGRYATLPCMDAPRSGAIADPRTRLVWDLPVRVMHWGIVLAGIGSYVTQEILDDAFRYHVWFGYTMLVLVLTRIVWGFVGSAHARFSSF